MLVKVILRLTHHSKQDKNDAYGLLYDDIGCVYDKLKTHITVIYRREEAGETEQLSELLLKEQQLQELLRREDELTAGQREQLLRQLQQWPTQQQQERQLVQQIPALPNRVSDG